MPTNGIHNGKGQTLHFGDVDEGEIAGELKWYKRKLINLHDEQTVPSVRHVVTTMCECM
jgi:hypothetical protein